jgi:hypothetical protein
MTTELIVIISLLIYIGIIHYQLYKKNSFIESLVRRQLNIEDIIAKQGFEEMIKKYRGLSSDSPLKQNKLFEQEIQNFILENESNEVLFIHYTKDQDVAQQITREGFRFADSFYKTAEPIVNDKLDFIYKHYLRKHYGNFVVVISISKNVYNHYLSEIAHSNKVMNVEHIISNKCPQLNENEDEVYLLPKEFIKGFINAETGEIYRNQSFNPNFDSPEFQKNLDKF